MIFSCGKTGDPANLWTWLRKSRVEMGELWNLTTAQPRNTLTLTETRIPREE